MFDKNMKKVQAQSATIAKKKQTFKLLVRFLPFMLWWR